MLHHNGLCSTGQSPQCENHKKIALDIFENIIRCQHNWKREYIKAYPGTRNLKNVSLPTTLCNLSLELEYIIGKESVNGFKPGLVYEVMNVFYQPSLGLILENVYEDGSFCDSFEGRTMNPGHTITPLWFIVDLGKQMQDEALITKVCTIMSNTLEYSWDEEFGGIF